jgi:flavodoxin I
MRVMVVYESEHGNTEKIAKAISGAMTGEISVVRARDASGSDLKGYDVLIVGAPTYGGRPMPPMQAFLDKLTEGMLANVKVCAFDTRLVSKFSKLFGYAAPKIAAILESKGGIQILPPEGFLVKASKGPLVDGEIERAAAWGKTLLEKLG